MYSYEYSSSICSIFLVYWLNIPGAKYTMNALILGIATEVHMCQGPTVTYMSSWSRFLKEIYAGGH